LQVAVVSANILQKTIYFNFLYLMLFSLFYKDKVLRKECRKKRGFLSLNSSNLLPYYITKDNGICFFGKKKRKKSDLGCHFGKFFPKWKNC